MLTESPECLQDTVERAAATPAPAVPMYFITPRVAADPRPDSLPARILRPVWRRLIPNRARMAIYEARARRAAAHAEKQPVTLPIDRVLLGGQAEFSANQFAQHIGQWRYPSTPVSDSPYTEFLRLYAEKREGLFEPGVLARTAWFNVLANCIRFAGQYAGLTSASDIERSARRYIAMAAANDSSPQPIEVRPIARSDCFQVIDGHHRAAIAWHKGARTIPAIVRGEPVLTPLQSLLLDGSWLDGRCELYQPIDAPELRQNWVLVRKCTDRLDRMRGFLQERGLLPPQLESYLDVGCAYGWFVKQMEALGFEAHGVDRDQSACLAGVVAYGMTPAQFTTEDIVHFLRTTRASYDVVSCVSVLHHYARGTMPTSAEVLIRLLDKATRGVLFFETGQGHEQWHRDSLAEWNDDFIENWLRRHTSFKTIHRLGRDNDAVPPFEKNYGRMLYACCR